MFRRKKKIYSKPCQTECCCTESAMENQVNCRTDEMTKFIPDHVKEDLDNLVKLKTLNLGQTNIEEELLDLFDYIDAKRCYPGTEERSSGVHQILDGVKVYYSGILKMKNQISIETDTYNEKITKGIMKLIEILKLTKNLFI